MTFLNHQLKIAIRTLAMSVIGARLAGGMTLPEAINLLNKNGWSTSRLCGKLSEHGHSQEEVIQLLKEARIN